MVYDIYIIKYIYKLNCKSVCEQYDHKRILSDIFDVRPKFTIEFEGSHLILELMGFTNNLYMRSKKGFTDIII